MTLWFLMIIPIVACIILMLFFTKKIVWWEYALLLGVPLFIILCTQGCAETALKRDTEYWAEHAIKAEYYEDWNEKVSCRHPEYCTRMESYTDSKGQTHMRTVTYQCGWQHPYDVDYHPEYWILVTNIGNSYGIGKYEFDKFCKLWNSRFFVELNRRYHTDDGDKYVSNWDMKFDHIEPFTTEHTYENVVQAANSIFNFVEVDTSIYPVYEYPEIRSYRSNPFLFNKVERKFINLNQIETAGLYLERWNALFGATKKIKVWVLLFDDKSSIINGHMQESYWKGGNKNEFVLCIGLNKNNTIRWTYGFSWTDVQVLKVDVRDIAQSGSVFNPEYVAVELSKLLQTKWIKKSFKDFNYLTVETPPFVFFLTLGIIILVTIGIATIVIMNNQTLESSNENQQFYKSYRD